jgi:pimeloyl-ACP methyl ester carboxylesterase
MQFVLVHGSFHGAWCWEHLIPMLEARGHRISAPNLPGSGGDPAPLDNASLATYATRIAATIDELAGPVVLVGHSMGGIVSSQVTEWRSKRLQAVVYVNGLLLGDGECLRGFLDAHQQLGVEDLVLKHMRLSEDGELATFPREFATDIFYNTCRADEADAATARLRPQPTQIYRDTLRLSAERSGSVRRFYIEGQQDRAIALPTQRAMTSRTPCERIYSLDCDHSPFLSARGSLADILDEIAHATQLRTWT